MRTRGAMNSIFERISLRAARDIHRLYLTTAFSLLKSGSFEYPAAFSMRTFLRLTPVNRLNWADSMLTLWRSCLDKAPAAWSLTQFQSMKKGTTAPATATRPKRMTAARASFLNRPIFFFVWFGVG